MTVELMYLPRAAYNSVKKKKTPISFKALLLAFYLQPWNLILRVELSVVSIFFFLHFFFPNFYNKHATFKSKSLYNMFLFVSFFLSWAGEVTVYQTLAHPNYHFLSIFPQLSPPTGGQSAFSSWRTHVPVRRGQCLQAERRARTRQYEVKRFSFCSGASELPTSPSPC